MCRPAYHPDRDVRSDSDSRWARALLTVGTALGMNRARLQWRLMRLERRLDGARAAHRARQATRICRHCHAVQPMDATVCQSCGEKLGIAMLSRLGKLGLAVPQAGAASAMLGLLIAAIYARMIIASGGDGLLSFDSATLVAFGACVPDTLHSGEWWRLGTSMLVHIGLWHAAFNLMALSQVGPAIELTFGRARMLFFFLATGVLANIASDAFDPGAISAGASGGLMGLIGVAAAWGHRNPTRSGRELRDRMIKWALYTLVFGWFIGADNVAHAGGFVAGAALGLVAKDTRSDSDTALGILGALTSVALAVVALSGIGSAAAEPYRTDPYGADPYGAEADDVYPDDAYPDYAARDATACNACIEERCAHARPPDAVLRPLTDCYYNCSHTEPRDPMPCFERCQSEHPEARRAIEESTRCVRTCSDVCSD